ncbi:hypothetical protein [Mycolicibacterium neoaurum]|uniref:hypothetical protein n=1 Tax=Mycolicibacterium neoaurum TaxID=1795 RepID=UPI001F4C7606|nr:hypothetical protein [Mycolicibacterium neoaurum]
MKKVTAADIGGAAYDSSGNIEGATVQSDVWVMAGSSPSDNQLYISLHTTQAGAQQRLQEKATEWRVPISRAGEVQPCDIETP